MYITLIYIFTTSLCGAHTAKLLLLCNNCFKFIFWNFLTYFWQLSKWILWFHQSQFTKCGEERGGWVGAAGWKSNIYYVSSTLRGSGGFWMTSHNKKVTKNMSKMVWCTTLFMLANLQLSMCVTVMILYNDNYGNANTVFTQTNVSGIYCWLSIF